MFSEIIGALWEAILDSLKIFPVLFLVYLLIEYLTHRKKESFYNSLKKNSKFGPTFGALLGCLPQCGFSAVMADMFNHKYISIGTLIAVFISTSDEAIPILLAHPDKYLTLIFLIIFKLIFALVFGYLFYLIEKLILKSKKTNIVGAQKTSEDYLKSHDCKIDEEHIHAHHHHKPSENCDCCSENIFLSALKHSAIILLYIFIANVVINFIFVFVGEETLISILTGSKILQIVLAPLIGLIPNCVSSVVLIELYLSGGLIFPALIGGLCAGSGVGLIILFKNKTNFKQNILIVFCLYLIGVISGGLLSLFI